MPATIKDTRPDWTNPENASVLDSPLVRVARWLIEHSVGSDPNSQLIGMMAPMSAGEEGGLAGALQKVIKAYHGSPHDFNQFDVSKIGTGEGAQAYGHGLYFAENPATAQSYRDALAQQVKVGGKPILSNNKMLGTTGDAMVDDLLVAHNGDIDAAIASEKVHRATLGNHPSAQQSQGTLQKLEALRGQVEAKNTGKMYEVAIKAHPDQFLDWDKPLSQQSEAVKQAIAAKWPMASVMDWETPNFYKAAPAAERSAELKATGIPGIKYLDQGSRPENVVQARFQDLVAKHAGDVEAAATEAAKSVYEPSERAALRDSLIRSYRPPTSNYVVFDDSTVEILKKWMLALATGGGALATAKDPQQ